MLGLLWLIPALPLAGFVLLALLGQWLGRRAAALVGVGSVGLAALLTMLVAYSFLSAPPAGHAFVQVLWTWLEVGGFQAAVAFYLDALSLVMIVVVTGVGFLIHLYSAEFMAGEEGYSRFFAYMNLFVAAMLILVLARDLPFLYLGWEGVGLCSFLLIGFWYRDPANGRAARKAFVVTRIGDTALLIGLLLIFSSLGTLQIPEVLPRAAAAWPVGSGLAIAAAALLLGGALGKSAQLPLQTWLPDAMAGPTPVSALIHAATMVTAGVYLIARTNVLFALAPPVQTAVALIGAATLLYAGTSALVQQDIKRALAYSTIAQIGYMFLALGAGAWVAAIFHFMTHAFFKSLLFLGAGVVILALHHEQNMLRMGGLRSALPLTFWTFVAGAASLAALPLVTAGFYSKEMILTGVWAAPGSGPWLWLAGTVGAFLTALYAFRLVFLTFCGPRQQEPGRGPDNRMRVPLVVLAVLSLSAGFVELPPTLGRVTLFADLLRTALPAPPGGEVAAGSQAVLQAVSALVSLVAVYLAYRLFLVRRPPVEGVASDAAAARLARFWRAGWGFDWLYERLFVQPYVGHARANRDDLVDLFYAGLARLVEAAYRLLSETQAGLVRLYAVGIVAGAVLVIAIGVLWAR